MKETMHIWYNITTYLTLVHYSTGGNTMKKNIIQGITIFILILLGSFFDEFSATGSPIYVAIGFAVIFLHYNKAAKYPIIIAIIAGNVVSQFLMNSNPIGLSLFYTFSYSMASIVEILLFALVLKYIKKLFHNDKNYLWFFLIDFLVLSFIGAFLMFFIFTIKFDFSNGKDIFISSFIRDFFGMIIFGSIGLYSKTYDEMRTKKVIISTVSLIVGFTIVVSLIFNYSNLYKGEMELSILLIPVFIFATIYINYRVLGYLSLIYIGLYQIIYLPQLGPIGLFDFFFSLNVTLFLLVTMSIVLRDRMIELRISYHNNEKTNSKLNGVLESITNLFAFRSSIDDTSTSFSDEYLEKVFDLAISVFNNFDGASCYVEKEGYIHFLKAYKYDKELLNNSRIPIAEFTFEVNKPIHVTNAEESIRKKTKERYKQYKEKTSSIKESVYVGFYLNENLRGGMSFDKFASNDTVFSSDEIDVFSHFQNTVNHLYQESYSLAEEITIKDSLLVGLVRALEVYDVNTKGHSEEVAKLSNLLAKNFDLTPNEVSEITYAGLLHDIGKIGISQSIINKTTRLLDIEYEVVKGHSKQGYDIIHKLVGMETISNLVLNHHERWDGLGYPNQLSGNENSLGSQIIAIADAVSTMLTGRLYSSKKTVEEVIVELKRCRGTQFSPATVDKMIHILSVPNFIL